MMTNKMSRAVSLDAVEKHFQQWRDGHEGRVRIPDELWSAAAAAARVHGVHSTARRLHLEYLKLDLPRFSGQVVLLLNDRI